MYMLFCVLVSVFAVYGAISALVGLYNKIMHINCEKKSIIVTMKNREDDAEGIIRCLMRENENCDIIVVDNDSVDETCEIIRRICSDKPCVCEINSETNV